MKRILFASVLMLTACATLNAPPTTTATSEKTPFIPHAEDLPMKSYLAMNLPYAPYKALYEQVQEKEDRPLNNRGEAHITVVTPVEFDKVLKKHITIAEINKIAEEAKIEETPFTPVCIGKAEKMLSGHLEKVYFVVVESPALIDLRGKIEDAYVKNGGSEQDFVPEKFLPHVTLGYTARDLHIEDGVVKNKSTCLYNLK